MGLLVTLEDDTGMILHTAAGKILPSTVTLYIPSTKGGGSLEPLGSGVLYREGAGYFLLTAGHCIKQKGYVIRTGILDGRNFHSLTGRVAIERGHGDKLDIGVIRLSESSAAVCLRNHAFIAANQIYHAQDVREKDLFLAAGFPNSKVSVDHSKKRIKKDLMPYACTPDARYEKSGYAIVK